MKTQLPLALLAWLAAPLIACAQPARPQVQQAELVATYPHDEAAFTQGLFIHDGVLFESTGQVGQSSLRRVELESGNVVQQVDINPPVFGEGSARIGDAIYMLSWLSQTGMVFVTLNGRPVRRINELEWVGTEIWANIWQTSSIVRIDPQTGIVTGLVDLTGLLPAGLADPRDAVATGIAWNRETGQIYVTGKLWPVLYEIRLPDSAE